MATAFTRTLSGKPGTKDHIKCSSACGGGPDKGQTLPTGIQGRVCRQRKTGRIVGAGLVRLSGHKLSFVCSISPEIAGTADSTACALRLNKAGKEAEGEGAKRKRKLK